MHFSAQVLHRKISFLPIGLFIIDILISLFALVAPKATLISFYFFSVGIFISWGSILTGLLAMFLLRDDRMAVGQSARHGFISSLPVIVQTVIWVSDYQRYPEFLETKALIIAIKLLMVFVLLYSATSRRKQVRGYV